MRTQRAAQNDAPAKRRSIGIDPKSGSTFGSDALDSLGLMHRMVQAAVQALLQKPVKPQDVVVVAPGKGLLIVPPAVDATEPRRRIQASLDVAFPEAS